MQSDQLHLESVSTRNGIVGSNLLDGQVGVIHHLDGRKVVELLHLNRPPASAHGLDEVTHASTMSIPQKRGIELILAILEEEGIRRVNDSVVNPRLRLQEGALASSRDSADDLDLHEALLSA